MDRIYTLKQLIDAEFQQRKAAHNGNDNYEDYFPKIKLSEKTHNSMKKCVVEFFKAIGGKCDTVNSMGVAVDKRHIVTDCIGISKQIGSIEYRKSNVTKGISDCVGSVRSKSGFPIKVNVEIKHSGGLRDDQKKYKLDEERAGNPYIVAHTPKFEQFCLDFWAMYDSYEDRIKSQQELF